MAKLIALYRRPRDKAAFDRYYQEVHAPLASQIPGLRGYEVSRGSVVELGNCSAYYMAAILTFDSKAALHAALESPEGRAAAEDLKRFATGGVDLFVFEHGEIALTV